MLADKKPQFSNPEIWGGIECTINRVGDLFYDQLEYSGHYNRDKDLEVIAELGVSKLRYPILWETHEPLHDQIIDWSRTSIQIKKLSELGIQPIVTLLHHGSGPVYTHLLDDSFPYLLAEYAGKVAKEFPSINYYTPVNEPLTTARFSGLYGFWFPHKRNDVSFIKMLLNELKGVVLSMIEIRKINPSAKLIQTEDLGKTYSTPILDYQANFENHRRWLTFDLLTGRVTSFHPLWDYLMRLGIDEKDLSFFTENACSPDIMGMNYYVTSERFLDHDITKYESNTFGSNDVQIYADIEAVRVPHGQTSGLKRLLQEAVDRYNIPIAVTEAHLNCSREEQLRWLKETWEDCCSLYQEGVPLVGFTIWSLLGAFGWDRLLLTNQKNYEPGAFDVRSGKLRPTAIARLIKDFSKQNPDLHPVTSVPGWWKRNIRYLDSFGIRDTPLAELVVPPHPPVLIVGKTGTLGKAFAKACSFRKINYVLLGRQEMDITISQEIEAAINKYKPWVIINAAGYVKVDEAETDVEKCFNNNAVGVQYLAESCKRSSVQLMSFSSDLVFDGRRNSPYLESDIVNPLNVYGKSKSIAERLALSIYPDTLMIRTSTFFSPYDQYNFVYGIINSISEKNEYIAATDIFISPTYVPDLVHTCLDLLIDNESGIWHLTSGEKWSWAQLANKVADHAGLDHSLINSLESRDIDFKAKRPIYSVLGTSKGIILPSFEDGLMRCIRESADIWKHSDSRV